jgi:hypothetical protein
MDNTTNLFIMVIFSSIGLAYFIYGKKQRLMIPTLVGVGLMVYPYFVANTVLLIIVGLVGVAIPWFFRDS